MRNFCDLYGINECDLLVECKLLVGCSLLSLTRIDQFVKLTMNNAARWDRSSSFLPIFHSW